MKRAIAREQAEWSHGMQDEKRMKSTLLIAAAIIAAVRLAREDSWIASQIANCIRGRGAQPFLDLANIPKGDNVRKIIRAEIAQSSELVVLFTPWSCQRSWVWIEMGAAWAHEMPVIAVFYGMELDDLEANGQGKGILEDTNVLNLNDIDEYFSELASSVDGASHA